MIKKFIFITCCVLLHGCDKPNKTEESFIFDLYGPYSGLILEEYSLHEKSNFLGPEKLDNYGNAVFYLTRLINTDSTIIKLKFHSDKLGGAKRIKYNSCGIKEKCFCSVRVMESFNYENYIEKTVLVSDTLWFLIPFNYLLFDQEIWDISELLKPGVYNNDYHISCFWPEISNFDKRFGSIHHTTFFVPDSKNKFICNTCYLMTGSSIVEKISLKTIIGGLDNKKEELNSCGKNTDGISTRTKLRNDDFNYSISNSFKAQYYQTLVNNPPEESSKIIDTLIMYKNDIMREIFIKDQLSIMEEIHIELDSIMQ